MSNGLLVDPAKQKHTLLKQELVIAKRAVLWDLEKKVKDCKFLHDIEVSEIQIICMVVQLLQIIEIIVGTR